MVISIGLVPRVEFTQVKHCTVPGPAHKKTLVMKRRDIKSYILPGLGAIFNLDDKWLF